MIEAGDYIPMDRRQALASGRELPEQSGGAALFADISGFTPLTEALVKEFGPGRAVEQLTGQLNQVYDALIAEVHRYGGSVVGFVGDAVTCWFEADSGLRASACGLAMQRALAPLARLDLPSGGTAALAIKVGIAAGPIRRLRVGDPQFQYLDVLVGATMQRMARAEQQARQGEVLLDPQTALELRGQIAIATERIEPESGQSFAVLAGLTGPVAPHPWPPLPPSALGETQLRPWLLPPVYERLQAGQGPFLAELRPAVALFLKFDGLDYDRDAAVGQKLDHYIRWVQHTISRYEGYLIQLTVGDKGSFLYGVFGAPIAHDDDAARAIAAAFELRAAPPDLDFMTARIGLGRGQMRVGAYGSQTRCTYGVIGNEAILAARLMMAAGAGDIWADYGVYRGGQSRWSFEALPPMRIKGRAGLIQVYRPTGEVVGRRQLTTGPQQALVGRQAELSRLHAALARLQAGEGRILIIEGEAGLGKSRLVAELGRLAWEQGLAVLLGAGQSMEQQTPYRAWRDIFSAYFNLNEFSDGSEWRQQVESLVQEIAPDQRHRLPLLNDMLNLELPETNLTASLDPRLRQQNLALLLLALLEAGLRERPLILVLEDAHWLDSLSWELALQLGRTLAHLPLLLVVALRPLQGEAMRVEAAALLGLERVEQVSLSPLSAEETLALAAANLGVAPAELPPALVNLVQERAGGNPFFAEELIYTLRDKGLITIEKDQARPRCRVSADLAQVVQTLPATIQEILLSRIDRLPPEEQITLKVAAVIGQTFGYTLLFDTLSQHHQISQRLLKIYLDDLSYLNFTPLKTVEPEPTYSFKHTIIQEVAYDTLLFAQRRQLHQTIARWYEVRLGQPATPHSPVMEPMVAARAFGVEPSGGGLAKASTPAPAYLPLLVHHYHHAEDDERERFYSTLAGDQALARGAPQDALRFYERALALLSRLQSQPSTADLITERIELFLALGATRRILGQHSASLADLQMALQLARQAGDNRQVARTLHLLSETADAQGHFADAQRYLDEGLPLARELAAGADQAPLAHILYRLGVVAWRAGRFEEATQLAQESLALNRQLNHRLLDLDLLKLLGLIRMLLKDYDQARAYYEAGRALAVQIGQRERLLGFLNNLAIIDYYEEAYLKARDYFQEAVTISREIGQQDGEALFLLNLSETCLKLGESGPAKRYAHEALQLALTIGSMVTAVYALVIFAQLDAHTGNTGRALALLELARHHPAADANTREEIDRVLAELKFAPETVEAGLAQGRRLDFEATVRELLQEE
jgi:predicted ATPase/class 3 adenylate cyclase